jgi:prephenate dehydratase
MFYVEISQNLLAKDGIALGDIEEIHSHEQALKQCKDYLAEKFWSKKLVEKDDTAKAAQDLAEGRLSDNTAVIASKNSAQKYGLNIIESDIHDLKKNLTLFLAVERIDSNE